MLVNGGAKMAAGSIKLNESVGIVPRFGMIVFSSESVTSKSYFFFHQILHHLQNLKLQPSVVLGSNFQGNLLLAAFITLSNSAMINSCLFVAEASLQEKYMYAILAALNRNISP